MKVFKISWLKRAIYIVFAIGSVISIVSSFFVVANCAHVASLLLSIGTGFICAVIIAVLIELADNSGKNKQLKLEKEKILCYIEYYFKKMIEESYSCYNKHLNNIHANQNLLVKDGLAEIYKFAQDVHMNQICGIVPHSIIDIIQFSSNIIGYREQIMLRIEQNIEDRQYYLIDNKILTDDEFFKITSLKRYLNSFVDLSLSIEFLIHAKDDSYEPFKELDACYLVVDKDGKVELMSPKDFDKMQRKIKCRWIKKGKK